VQQINVGATYVEDAGYSSCLNTPYHNNTGGNIVWLSHRYTFAFGSSYPKILKSTNGFASYSEISLPSTTAANNETAIKRLGIEIYVQNSNQVAIWNRENRFFRTSNGSTFSEVSYSGYSPASHGNVAGAGGFPTAGQQYYIVTDTRYVFVTTNGGTTWTSKTGNLQSIITANDPGVNGIEKGVIVPDWTE
jgi:hypothetical protein